MPELAGAPVAEPLRPTVATIRKAGGRRYLIGSTTAVNGLGAGAAIEPGDLAQAALMLVARSPELFARPSRIIAGIPAYLPERAVLDALNEWIGRLFAPEHRDETVDLLLASAGMSEAESTQRDVIKTKITQGRTTLRRLQDAIKAGANPVALVEPINQAQAELEAALAEEAQRPETRVITRAEVYAMIDYLGNVGAALKRGDPAELQKLYEALRLEIIYHADQKAAELAIRLGRDSERVRGGT